MNPRRLFIQFFTRAIWRFSPSRKLKAIQEFSLIEKDSGCQILSAIGRISDPRMKAALFQQVLEEFHHADLFRELCDSLADSHLDEPVITRDNLVEADSKFALLNFLCYLHVGEREVNRDFVAYAAAADPQAAKTFNRVRADEARHERDSYDLLVAMAGKDQTPLKRALLQSHVTRLWRSYVKLIRQIGEYPLHLMLSAIYIIAGPFLYRTFKRRINMEAAEQFRIFSKRCEMDPA